MPRVHFDVLSGRAGGFHEARVPIPATAPPGYTPMILVTEWLTMNCRGDWSCRVRGRVIVARFAAAADHSRAVMHFMNPA